MNAGCLCVCMCKLDSLGGDSSKSAFRGVLSQSARIIMNRALIASRRQRRMA